LKIRPFESDIIEDEALKVGNVSRETIQSYDSPQTQKKAFDDILSKYVDKFNKSDKFHLAGYNNASFDNQFLRRFYEKCGDKYFGSNFWSDSIDVMVLASYKLQNKRSLIANFKLGTVASFCGIDVKEDGLHDALYDVILTRKIYYKLFFNKDV
jgi:DNA polymerase III subunit epsilon